MNKELTTEAIFEAYSKLDNDEGECIDCITRDLINGMSDKSRRLGRSSSGFGDKAALELVGKLGIFLYQEGYPVE